MYIYTQYDGCQTQVFGTIAFDGSSFSKYWGSGRYKAEDNCIEANNLDRPINDEDSAPHLGERYAWKFDQDPLDGKAYLFIGPAGSGEFASYTVNE